MPDPVLTPTELAGLRAATESWFPDVCDIYRVAAQAGDDYGGYGSTNADTVIAAGVPCSVESGAEHVQIRALLAKIENVQAFAVTFPANTDVKVGDHLVLTSRANDRLRVEGVLAPESWEIERRVIASELE